MTEPYFHVERFRKTFLLGLVAAISIAFVVIIRPFLTPLLLAAIFTGLSFPIQRRLTGLLGGGQFILEWATAAPTHAANTAAPTSSDILPS